MPEESDGLATNRAEDNPQLPGRRFHHRLLQPDPDHEKPIWVSRLFEANMPSRHPAEPRGNTPLGASTIRGTTQYV